MTDNNQTIEQKISIKKKTVKQLELDLKRLEQQQQKARDRLAQQIANAKEKELRNQARKARNKKIYDWGSLVPMVLGIEEFDKLANDQNFKHVFIGAIAIIKKELETHGFGITSDNKKTTLSKLQESGIEFLKSSGKNLK